MGLPEISLTFESLGTSAINRSARGIIACVMEDSTVAPELFTTLSSVSDLSFDQWTEKSYEYLKLIFMGAPYKVMVFRTGDSEEITKVLKRTGGKTWNYLTIPGIKTSDVTLVSAWIKEQRDTHKKTYKAVLPNCAADHEGIINFTTDNFVITDGEKELKYSCAEYCSRIAGLLAGLPLSRSSTFYELDEVISCDVPDDADTAIDAGQLVVVYDEEKFKIGRGVNSLVTHSRAKGESWSKIKIVDGIDLYRDDITSTYKNQYVGRVINDYDSKQAFVAAVLAYNKSLEGDVLDKNADNTCYIDVEAQRAYLKSKGIDTEEMSEQEIAAANTGAKVFLRGKITFVDTMEDLDFGIEM